MPLTFQRQHNSLFTQQRSDRQNIENKATEPEEQTTTEPGVLDFFRFYPLSHELEHNRKNENKVKQVSPLPLSTNPLAAHAQLRRQAEQARQNAMPRSAQQVNPQSQRPVAPQANAASQPHHGFSAPQVAPPLFQNNISAQHHNAPVQNRMPSHRPDTQPAALPSPEMAAEQFRRINKGLPDGVMYEPLDDETMRLLKQHSAKQGSQPHPPTPSPTLPPTLPKHEPVKHELPANISATLQKLAQDEHNAQIFYSEISQNAPTSETKKVLLNLAEDCEARMQQYIKMLSTQFNNNFAPQKKEINTNLPFNPAISLAVSEENKALSTLSSLIDQVEETGLERQVQRMINKKILGHQLLLSLKDLSTLQ